MAKGTAQHCPCLHKKINAPREGLTRELGHGKPESQINLLKKWLIPPVQRGSRNRDYGYRGTHSTTGKSLRDQHLSINLFHPLSEVQCVLSYLWESSSQIRDADLPQTSAVPPQAWSPCTQAEHPKSRNPEKEPATSHCSKYTNPAAYPGVDWQTRLFHLTCFPSAPSHLFGSPDPRGRATW